MKDETIIEQLDENKEAYEGDEFELALENENPNSVGDTSVPISNSEEPIDQTAEFSNSEELIDQTTEFSNSEEPIDQTTEFSNSEDIANQGITDTASNEESISSYNDEEADSDEQAIEKKPSPETDILGGKKDAWSEVALFGKKSKETSKEYFDNVQKNFKQKTLRNRKLLSTILSLIAKGENAAGQHTVLESLKIDDEWIINIEGNINHIDNIVRNPKSALKEERLIVNTSKAKRTDSETIRYLSSHTSDIESIDGDEIRPSRLNVREIDSDIATYENRFVYALMVRLRSFLEQRYKVIKEQIDCNDSNELKLKSKFDTSGGEVEYDLSIKISDKKQENRAVRENLSLLERIETCRMHISSLMGSDFARTLAKTKLLIPPISRTNAIRGHVDYKACYNLWLFLSSYTAVGYSVKVEEQNLELTGEYYDDLSFIVAMSVKNMMDNNRLGRSMFDAGAIKRKIKKYKPVKNFTYSHSRRNIPEVLDEHRLSQFYFDKIKKLLAESEKAKETKEGESRDIAFRDYFKNIKTMSDQLFDEALELEKYRKAITSEKNQDANKENIEHYNESLKRLKLLRRLKESDYNKTLREEKEIEQKIAKLNERIAKQKEKEQEIKQKERAAKQAKLNKQKELEELKLAKEKDIQRLKEEKRKAMENQKSIKEKEQEKARLAKQKEQEKARLAKQKAAEQEKARLAKEKEQEKAKLAKQKAIEQEKAKKAKEKEQEKARLAKQKEQEKAKLAKQKAIEQEKARIAKEKEQEKAKLSKEKEQEKTKQAKQKTTEQERAKLAKEKEQERARLAKEKEQERARLAKEKEQEKAKLAKEKEQEKAKLAKEKERERARLAKQKALEQEKARLAKKKEQEQEKARLAKQRELDKARLARELEKERQRYEKELAKTREKEMKEKEKDPQKLEREAEQERLRKEAEKAWKVSIKTNF